MIRDEWKKACQKDYPYLFILQFSNGEERPEQERRIDDYLKAVGLSWTDISHRWEGALTIDLAFKSFDDYARFTLHTTGDSKRYSTKCVLEFPDGVNDHWMRAAKAFCAAAELKPDIQVSENQATFVFEYFSELAGFRIAVENEEITPLAHALHRQDTLWKMRPKPETQPVLKPYHALAR